MTIGRLLPVEGPADKRERGFLSRDSKKPQGHCPWKKEEGNRAWGVSKAATAVAKKIGFSSLKEMNFCCQHAVASGSQSLSNFLPIHSSSKRLWGTYCVPAFPLESPKQPHKANA